MTFFYWLPHFFIVLYISLAATALGVAVLQVMRVEIDKPLERGLYACGLGLFAIELVVLWLSIRGWLSFNSAWLAILIITALAGRGWMLVFDLAKSVLGKAGDVCVNGDWKTRTLCVAIAAVSLFEAVVSSAPLSGSDAMHYHFTVPLLELGHPLQPIFSITHSFLVGTAHLLISLGLVLGGDTIALSFIYLGGLFTAATLYVIARQLMPRVWALFAALTFLISPMVFWQITTSGSPDIWMGAYLGLAVLAASRAIERDDWRMAVLAGVFSGNAAGVKYTGWVVPIAVCGYLLIYIRPRKTAYLAGYFAFILGALPLLRNAIWTKDPFFPFFSRWLNPAHVDNYARNFLLADTKSRGFSHGILHMLAFPFSLTIHGESYGLGQYFGPLVLAFAPLVLLAAWKNHVARLAAFALALGLLVNVVTAQMGRFLLPFFALALALVFSGIVGASERRWRAAVHACAATATLFVVFAGASDLVYAKDFLPVVMGKENGGAFLTRMAPDYQLASFVNETLAPRKQTDGGVAMVFFRHLYYLRVPYVNGDPSTSWIVNPETCGDEAGLLRALEEQKIRWIVKSPDYPDEVSKAFLQLESEGKLVPIATANIESFSGNSRIYRDKITFSVTILELHDK